jgi:hypothetical protein
MAQSVPFHCCLLPNTALRCSLLFCPGFEFGSKRFINLFVASTRGESGDVYLWCFLSVVSGWRGDVHLDHWLLVRWSWGLAVSFPSFKA